MSRWVHGLGNVIAIIGLYKSTQTEGGERGQLDDGIGEHVHEVSAHRRQYKVSSHSIQQQWRIQD